MLLLACGCERRPAHWLRDSLDKRSGHARRSGAFDSFQKASCYARHIASGFFEKRRDFCRQGGSGRTCWLGRHRPAEGLSDDQQKGPQSAQRHMATAPREKFWGRGPFIPSGVLRSFRIPDMTSQPLGRVPPSTRATLSDARTRQSAASSAGNQEDQWTSGGWRFADRPSKRAWSPDVAERQRWAGSASTALTRGLRRVLSLGINYRLVNSSQRSAASSDRCQRPRVSRYDCKGARQPSPRIQTEKRPFAIGAEIFQGGAAAHNVWLRSSVIRFFFSR